MNRFFPLSLAVLLTASAEAQVSIGNRVGLSLSHQETTDSEFIERNGKGQTTLVGLSSAIVIESKIKPFLAVQVELGVTQKGRQNADKSIPADYYRMRLNYGEGQFLAKGIVGKGPAKLNILAGISFGRGLVAAELGEFQNNDTVKLSGQGTYVYNSGHDTLTFSHDTTLVVHGSYLDRYLPFEADRKGGMALTEWSFVGGLGVSFDLGRSRLFIEGRYVQGLTPIYNGKLNEPDVFNRSLLINFGYLVQLNDPKKNTSAKPEAPQY